MPPQFWAHPTAVIDAPADIGDGTKVWHFCHVMAGAHIGPGCSLGQNVYVGARAVVGAGCKIQNNVSLYDAVTLEDEVFVGPSAVFTNVVNPRAFVVRKDQYRPTLVRRGASIGANATIVCGHEIGAYAFVAAGAVVTRDVPPHALVKGVPATLGGWVCRCGVSLRESLVCPECQTRYRREGAGLAEDHGPEAQR
jgi:UDP-2-acetamido-3-amino-2,3-dideoxy-glucuronate N-acetyltransferase